MKLPKIDVVDSGTVCSTERSFGAVMTTALGWRVHGGIFWAPRITGVIHSAFLWKAQETRGSRTPTPKHPQESPQEGNPEVTVSKISYVLLVHQRLIMHVVFSDTPKINKFCID